MFEDISKTLGKSFIISSFFPGLIFVTFNVIFLLPHLRPMEITYISSWDDLSLVYKISFVLLAACIVGFFISSINIPLIRLYEGYYRFQKEYLFNPLLKRQLKRFSDISERLKQKTCVDSEYVKLQLEVHFYFPPKDKVMPTKLGNLFAAFEWYSKKRYGIDSVAFWPRLISVIPEGYSKIIDDAKSSFDFLINTSFFMFILGIESIIFALFIIGIEAITFAPKILWYMEAVSQLILALKISLLFGFKALFAFLFLPFLNCCTASMVVVIIAFFLAYLLYLSAISAAYSLGEVIKSCFDLYRRDLLVQMGITLPESLDEEKRLWDDLAKFIIYNP